jgi:hypothetical protein
MQIITGSDIAMQTSLRHAYSVAVGLAVLVLPGAALGLLVLYAISRRSEPGRLTRLFSVLAGDTAAAIQALKSLGGRWMTWTHPT